MNETMNLNGIAPAPISNVEQSQMTPITNSFIDNSTSQNSNNNINTGVVQPQNITPAQTPSIFSDNTVGSSILQGQSNMTNQSLMPLDSNLSVQNTNQQPGQSQSPVQPTNLTAQQINYAQPVNNDANIPTVTQPNNNLNNQIPAVVENIPQPQINVGQAQPAIPQGNNNNQNEVLPSTTEEKTNAVPTINNNIPNDVNTNNSVNEQQPNPQTTNEHYTKNDSLFSNIDFGPLMKYLNDDNITDISYSNGGQLWLKTLDKGIYREEVAGVNDALVEKIAFQCSNVMGKTFNMAHPFLDSESAELRMNFVHDSIAKNGIAAVFRKTPAKIRLEKEKILAEKYVTVNIHDFLIECVKGHCNIIVSGETGSGKTELVKYLASHTAENEKLITIEDTLELHLDRIFPQRDIVAMKTNNIASYSDVLVTCMRQNPKWILLSEVRSAEAVTAVRNSISSGHNILSTIHSDKAENIPHRMYSLLESNIDVEQFLKTIYRYIQLGVFVRGRYDNNEKRFVREIAEVTEFFVDDDNNIGHNTIYRKTVSGVQTYNEPSKYLKSYLEGQGIDVTNLLGLNNKTTTNEVETL